MVISAIEEQSNTGATLSLTFIHCSQVDSLPAASTKCQVNTVSPTPNEEGNSSSTPGINIPQLSVALGVTRATSAVSILQAGVNILATMVGNVVHLITGADLSSTLMTWEQVVALPALSANCQVMVVSPRPNVDGRTAVPTISLSLLSFAFGAVSLNALRHE